MTGTGADQAEKARLLFEAKAPQWSAKYAPGGALTSRLTALREHLWQLSGPRSPVLDLGCGTGELARALAAAGLAVSGCDISAAMLDRAAAKARDSPAVAVDWVLLPSDWQVLPWPDATFEVIVAASVLEYVPRPGAVLAECARLLRPGGVLLATVPDRRHPVRWLESPLRLAARRALPSAIHGPRLRGYAIYLQVSRNRRRLRWWRSAAAGAGLVPLPDAPSFPPRTPLRLLACRRAAP